MKRAVWSVVVVAVALCLGAGTALAHGDKIKTSPKKNARVAMPKIVSVTLSEAPVPQSQLSITDGCGRDVTGEVSVDDDTLQASVGEAQPGKWKAAYRVVSAVDGHPTQDDWTFHVQGTADCDAEDDEPTAEPSEEPEETDEDAAAEEDDSDTGGTSAASSSDDGSFPVMPVVLGGVALLALAAVVRAKTTG
ncbi:MAG: copper resistance CopC family protein [Actinomycetota bacterium]